MTSDPRHRLDELLEDSNPPFEKVMSCVFGIEDHETRTYLALRDRPGSTIEELATALDRDRSTVNRALSTLHERGLVRRDRRLLDGGGYVYQYTAVALPEAKAALHQALDTWTGTVHDVIDEFDGRSAGAEADVGSAVDGGSETTGE
ncbi:helix-turn-helix domain-containing protein [Halosolutus amylolyticus]|uniref:Helix-turn-helix domain-containing protein n=1 Tax=Halosolutus amylolyticus TaxID=2932267 RepID=A0ABD5PKE3_9EURY|nr:helix-turn-helix domain-containing protein [Halosolutus amylolyticus]